MERKISVKLAKILIGLLILATAFVGYGFSPARMYQLTFISNASCGLLLLLDGTLGLVSKKSLPIILYQLVLPCTNAAFCTVFFTILGWHRFNFSGMFFFMHAINPIVFLFMYLLFTKLELKNKKDYIRRIFIAPVMVMAYALFDLIRFLITGTLVYGLIAADKLNCISVTLIGIGLYLSMAFMSYGLLELKLYIQTKTERNLPVYK